jgi:hypothetical protein
MGSAPIPASSELTAYERSLADRRPIPPAVRPTVRRRRRCVSFVGVLFTVLVLFGPVLGISLVSWGFITAHHADTESRELSDPNLSDRDRAALGLPQSVTDLSGPGAAAAITSSFEHTLGPGTRFTQISLYSDYAVAVQRVADQAVGLTGVEDGAVTYVIVDRSTSDRTLPITISVYVSGPRSSGYVEASAAGDITAVY